MTIESLHCLTGPLYNLETIQGIFLNREIFFVQLLSLSCICTLAAFDDLLNCELSSLYVYVPIYHWTVAPLSHCWLMLISTWLVRNYISETIACLPILSSPTIIHRLKIHTAVFLVPVISKCVVWPDVSYSYRGNCSWLCLYCSLTCMPGYCMNFSWNTSF